MARERWTLALIIICLPILVTVITAFRVRDLPKNQDISKLDVKKVQPCENCDAKAGSKVHSVKIESDKNKLDELKKAVRDKQQQINQKNSESKPVHKYDVRSEEDNDDDDDLDFLKVKTGFIQELPKVSKLGKIAPEVKSESANKKVFIKNDDDDEDEDDDEESKETSKPLFKVNILEKSKPVIKSALINKITVSKIEKKIDSKEKGDSDDDEDDDDDDDDYDGLDNVEELFKILDIKKKPKTQNVKDIKNKKEEKPTKLKQLKESIDNNSDNDKDDDDNDDKNDEKLKNQNIAQSSKQKAKNPTKFKQSEEFDKNKEPNDDQDDDDDDDDDDESDEKQNSLKSLKMNKKVSHPVIKEMNKDKEHPIKDTKPPDTKQSKEPQKQENVKKTIEIKSVTKAPVTNKNIQDTKTKINIKVEKAHDVKDTAKPVQKDKGSDEVKKAEKPEDSKSINVKPKGESIKKPIEAPVVQKPKVDDKTSKKDKEPANPTEPEKVKPKLESKEVKSNVSSKKTEKEPIKPNSQVEPRHEQKLKEKNSKEEEDDEYANLKKIKLKKAELDKQEELKSHEKESRKDKQPTEKLHSDIKHEDYLQHVTDALQRRNLMKSEFEDFYAFFPTFAPNFSRIHNPECRRHGLIVMRQLRGSKIWALNMLDATAKIPSGVLQGNGIQLGDFDQCVGSRARVQLDTGSVVKVQGKYCLARIDVKAEHTELEAPVYLAQAKSLIRSRIDDPGHFVPRFSTLSWGVCVPAVCKSEDVEVILKDAIKHYQHTSGVIIRVRVDEEDCHVDDGDSWDEWLEIPTILTLSFYGIIILLVLVATIQDFLSRRQFDEGQGDGEKPEGGQENEEKDAEEKKTSDGFIKSFSLYRTLDKLVAPGTDDEISCIHGIRGVATLALLVAHKFLPVAVMPYTNRIKITEIASSPIWSWCRAGWIFTDCFLLLSGTLTAHRIASDSDSGATRRLFSRYLRLTPALLAVVLFYAYIWDKLSTGPMWGTFVTKNAEVCQQGWWWNLLYVQNYFGFEDMCAPQTHQLALDMQLTILGSIIIWALQSDVGFMRLLLPAIHLISAYLRYTTVRDHRLTLLAYHGVSVSQLYRTARLTYMSTLHRCSPYLIGISLGLALKKSAKHGKILLTLGWLTSAFLYALVVWAGLDSGSTQYRYSVSFAAQYAAIAPLASAMATAWIIYAVHTGTCGFLSRWLCCRPLVLISRLSYALYLTQFIVFITHIGTVKTSREFTLISLVDVQETIAIMFVSTILTLTFVIPMQSLHKVFTFKSKSEPETTEEKSEEPTQKIEEKESVEKVQEEVQMPVRRHLLAHREVLEEIPEMEVEYETQRERNDALDEILEEEEEVGEEGNIDDLEIIEEEEAGEEEAWMERHRERISAGDEDRDLDEWEWTNGNGRTGAQYCRYAR